MSGQGSLEYLLMAAAILVIAVVVVITATSIVSAPQTSTDIQKEKYMASLAGLELKGYEKQYDGTPATAPESIVYVNEEYLPVFSCSPEGNKIAELGSTSATDDRFGIYYNGNKQRIELEVSECILTCAEQAGFECTIPKICLQDYLAASDIGTCCPETCDAPPTVGYTLSGYSGGCTNCAGITSIYSGQVMSGSQAYTADADGAISSYDWSYGDGTSQSSRTVQHSWSKGGTYTMFISATDDRGATTTKQVSVNVVASATTCPTGKTLKCVSAYCYCS